MKDCHIEGSVGAAGKPEERVLEENLWGRQAEHNLASVKTKLEPALCCYFSVGE